MMTKHDQDAMVERIASLPASAIVKIAKDESKWEWTIGGSSTDKKFLSSNAVVERESSDKMKESTVHVTGALIAGTADPINVTIKGTVTDGLKIETDNNLTNQKVKAGITQGTFDYANTLSERLDELNKLIAAYDAEKDGVKEFCGTLLGFYGKTAKIDYLGNVIPVNLKEAAYIRLHFEF